MIIYSLKKMIKVWSIFLVYKNEMSSLSDRHCKIDCFHVNRIVGQVPEGITAPCVCVLVFIVNTVIH